MVDNLFPSGKLLLAYFDSPAIVSQHTVALFVCLLVCFCMPMETALLLLGSTTGH